MQADRLTMITTMVTPKYETLASLGIAAFICLTSWEILKKGISRFMNPAESEFHIAGIIIILATIVINYFVASYERKKADELESAILKSRFLTYILRHAGFNLCFDIIDCNQISDSMGRHHDIYSYCSLPWLHSLSFDFRKFHGSNRCRFY